LDALTYSSGNWVKLYLKDTVMLSCFMYLSIFQIRDDA